MEFDPCLSVALSSQRRFQPMSPFNSVAPALLILWTSPQSRTFLRGTQNGKSPEPIDRVAPDRYERCEHVRTHDNQASSLQPDARAGLPAFESVHECSLHGAISCMRIPAGRPIMWARRPVWRASAFSSEVDTGSHSNQVYADCV